jgi:hypothetical protein
MKTIVLNRDEVTFTDQIPDLRSFEKAWREDCPNSLPDPNYFDFEAEWDRLCEEIGFTHD